MVCLNFGHLFVALSLKVYYGYGVYDEGWWVTVLGCGFIVYGDGWWDNQWWFSFDDFLTYTISFG